MAQGSQQLQAIDIREAEIEDHEIGLPGEQLERRLAVRRIQHLVALGGEPHAQELADGRLVVDDQDLQGARAHAAASANSADCVTGRVIVNAAPLRSVRFAAVIVPCMTSTKPREIESPSPVPART